MTVSKEFKEGFWDPRPRFMNKETSGKIRSVFIANRGEVAVRVIRTLRRMGIRSVAAYEAGDEVSRHVLMADHAIALKSTTHPSVFLDIEEMVSVAKEHGCDAVHPGWGYLSENAEFIQACEDAGLIFIGPSPEAVRLLGNKVSARGLAESIGVPLPGGSGDPVKDWKEARKEAKRIGLPVLLKASAGGGGRGIRVVRDFDVVESEFSRASSEAMTAFGCGDIFVEAFLENARHIEVQVIGDQSGQVFALGTRDCSIQRRRQKVIEEAEAYELPQGLREVLCGDAIKICTSAKYFGAGTVEFLVMKDGRHVFLEVNTRLQVEHPVTEAVIGQDLVWLQVLVAAGHPLPKELGSIAPLGHAIEVRILAEDPLVGFAPQTGLVRYISWPETPTVRVETALVPGAHIGLKYDPLIAKVICWGKNRNEAIDRMAQALDDTRIIGVSTNLHLLRYLMDHPEYQMNKIDTGVLERWIPDYVSAIESDPARLDAARAAAVLWANPEKQEAETL